MANAETFKQLEPKYLSGTTYVDFATYAFSNSGNTLTIAWPDTSVSFNYDPSTKQVTEKNGSRSPFVIQRYDYDSDEFDSLRDFIASDSRLNGNSYWTRDVEGDGYYAYVFITAPNAWDAAGGNISAQVQYSYLEEGENIDNWRDVDGTLTMTANFNDLPEASIVASVDRYGYRAVTGSLTLKYSDVTIVVSGDIDANDKDDIKGEASVIVKTSAGELAIYPDLTIGGVRGSVKVNGVIVGTIREAGFNDEALIITYVNGEFETITF